MTRPATFSGKRADLKMTLALGGALVAAVALAIASSRTTQDASPRSEDPPPAATPAAAADAPPAAAEAGLTGDVLETLSVSKYTYLRLGTSDGEEWAAVPSAAIAVGSRVTIANATRMDDFKSTTLKRTFKVIYFGNLGQAAGADPAAKFSAADVPQLDDDPALPPGHPDIGGAAPLGSAASDSDTLPPGHPDIGATAAPSLLDGDRNALPEGHPDIGTGAAHAGATGTAAEPPLPALPIEPARGSNAHVISELNAERLKLAGRRVRVRGQVTKVTPDVNGRAFFHLHDGNAGAGAQPPDLVATALAAPERGQVAVFEGTLRADVDVGIGYKYPVLLEDATVVGQ
jgi:hypothetical protein